VLVGQKNNDGWVLRVDGNGDVIWSKTYGGANVDVLTDVLVSGSFIFAGGSTRSAGAGNWDAWILKLNLNDGSAEEEVRNLMPRGSGVMVLAYTKSWGAGGTDFWAFYTRPLTVEAVMTSRIWG
jgi:hypothetical protein